MYTRKLTILLIGLSLFLSIYGQVADNDFLKNQWEAKWITVPGTNPEGYGVYLFRKEFELKSIPASFPVFVSADNRYKLFLNEKLVSMGPAKSDLANWKFEQVNLSPYLVQGENIISVKVWNEAEFRPEFQISLKTGFIIQGASERAKLLNTNQSWKCIQDHSYSPVLVNKSVQYPNTVKVPGYYVAGPGEKVDMHLKIKGWKKLRFDDGKWNEAETFSSGTPKKAVGVDVSSDSWRLVPSDLPQMELKKQRIEKFRRAVGVALPELSTAGEIKFTVPSNTTATILFDQTFLTNAFPTLIFSQGGNSMISLTYAEAMYDDDLIKGNRDSIEGKQIVGRKDIIISDGSEEQNFTPLAYRTYRYIEMKIETKETPLVIDDFYGTFTGYPFQLNANLVTNNAEMQKIIDIGWRTARLCANETYMDCPYWEQLQYIGDTRIQALVSLFNSGDDRLVKNAINLMDQSRQADGITLSRYPTINSQIIPTFSLWYIGMLHDYMMYGADSSFIVDKLPGERQILHYFENFQGADFSLRDLPNWYFVDWVDEWKRGMPPVGEDGSSAVLDLQLLMAFQYAVEIEEYMGMEDYVLLYNRKAKQLAKTIKKKYWDETRGLFADTPEKNYFSQHTNSLAILGGLVDGTDAKEIGQLILSDKTLTQASIYFRYYVHQALVKAGLGDNYLDWLDIWRENIELGLSTWGEDTDVKTTRSDCHAWGASPNIEFYRTILGIDSSSPNFKTVKIEPHLGQIKQIGGTMPHPEGQITVNYDIEKKKEAEITLPSNISGEFIWNDRSFKLHSGQNRIKLE